MADDDSVMVMVTDIDGREVALLARIWEQKITRDHPELAGHLAAVVEAVARPDHIEADVLPSRTRFYRLGAGPEPMATRGRKLRAAAWTDHHRAG